MAYWPLYMNTVPVLLSYVLSSIVYSLVIYVLYIGTVLYLVLQNLFLKYYCGHKTTNTVRWASHAQQGFSTGSLPTEQ